MKILIRYISSAVAVAMTILLINFVLLVSFLVNSGNLLHNKISVSELSDKLTKKEGTYTLPDNIQQTLMSQNQWAMLIDEEGDVKWSFQLPADVPLNYSLSEVASFTRWYLNDYPVYVWQHADGLVVLGYPKNSIWKHDMIFPQSMLQNYSLWFSIFLIANTMAAILLAFLFAFRLFHSLKRLTKGIKDLTTKQFVSLPTNGILGDLADGINKASLKLITQEEALNKRDTARTTWIAGISHDIRTPLSIAMGYASQLEADLTLSKESMEQATTIRKQCEKIKTLVNDLNLASKLEYEMQPLRMESILLAPLVRSVAVDFLNNLVPKQYHLEVLISDYSQNISIEGDVELLKRAVSNLIINSMTHNPSGCDIQISLNSDSNNSTLCISDNGKGFTKEMLYTLNHEKASVELNTHGIGLIIVRQVIKSHNGTTQFVNQEGRGCCTILCLPILKNISSPLSKNFV